MVTTIFVDARQTKWRQQNFSIQFFKMFELYFVDKGTVSNKQRRCLRIINSSCTAVIQIMINTREQKNVILIFQTKVFTVEESCFLTDKNNDFILLVVMSFVTCC